MRWLFAGLLGIGLVPAHGPGEGIVCDRFSVCFVCDDGTCLLPGLPLPGLERLLP